MMTKENIKKMGIDKVKRQIRLKAKFKLLKEEWRENVYQMLLAEQQEKEAMNDA